MVYLIYCQYYYEHCPLTTIILVILTVVNDSLAQDKPLQEQVTIRRTAYGVPHILAENLRAVAFGLAYAECEDRGDRVILPLIDARGIIARYDTTQLEARIEADFYRRLIHERTAATYMDLSQDTRDILEGFAAGVNYYLSIHSERFPQWYQQDFTGVDVAARSNGAVPTPRNARQFLQKIERDREARRNNDDAGSNVWAFAPERTTSGNAILMRNPHLSWQAGYYEAHITVPGKINYYGDFRIGGMFAIIGGFNERLGWSTTNNNPDLEEVYALKVDPEKEDHYLLDGESHALRKQVVEVEFKDGTGLGVVKKEWLYTPHGPVIHHEDDNIYIVKTAGWNNFKRGEQFTRMMLANNLEEWKEAMRIQAITSSNYTYADADGNIFYVWNAMTPKLNHEFLGDTVAHEAQKAATIWQEIVPFDELPQLQNPPGGYLQNSNDPFYFTNLNAPMALDGFPDNFPEPRLRLRSQHSLSLIHNDKKFSLEDIVKMKHSDRVLAADRLKEDLVEIIKDKSQDKRLLKAANRLAEWDNTASIESRGSVLFNNWFFTYRGMIGAQEMYATPWDAEKPTTTPYGISNADSAFAAFERAIKLTKKRHGKWDVKWGDVYRVRRGKVNEPVAGGSGTVGNFRVLSFRPYKKRKYSVVSGDGWVFAVEFGDQPRAYSVLAYGQSNDRKSPHFDDQAKMFAEGKMKKVAFTEEDIAKQLVKSYRPGEE